MSKFKVKDIVQDDCKCLYKILKVGYKYYTCESFGVCGYTIDKKFTWLIEIEILNKRAKYFLKEK